MNGAANAAGRTGLARDLVRSALLGLASGGRTFTGLAVWANTAAGAGGGPVNRKLAVNPVRTVVSLAALGELAADKLPQAPSRLSAPGLSGRLLAGAGCGAVVAASGSGTGPDDTERGEQIDPRTRTAVCAVVGAVAALTGAWLGAEWRSFAAPRPKRHRERAFAAAVVEDAAVLAIAVAGARR